jgi:hypothetical protein
MNKVQIVVQPEARVKGVLLESEPGGASACPAAAAILASRIALDFYKDVAPAGAV